MLYDVANLGTPLSLAPASAGGSWLVAARQMPERRDTAVGS